MCIAWLLVKLLCLFLPLHAHIVGLYLHSSSALLNKILNIFYGSLVRVSITVGRHLYIPLVIDMEGLLSLLGTDFDYPWLDFCYIGAVGLQYNAVAPSVLLSALFVFRSIMWQTRFKSLPVCKSFIQSTQCGFWSLIVVIGVEHKSHDIVSHWFICDLR